MYIPVKTPGGEKAVRSSVQLTFIMKVAYCAWIQFVQNRAILFRRTNEWRLKWHQQHANSIIQYWRHLSTLIANSVERIRVITHKPL